MTVATVRKPTGTLLGPRRQPPHRKSEATASRILERLAGMSRPERTHAAHNGDLSYAERALWAARYPDEVPIVNGEFDWIALTLADLD
jgi:hypothetical protein